MHVLILPSWYPKYPGDAGGSFFREQALALKAYGVEKVGIIYPELRSIKNIGLWLEKGRKFTITDDEGLLTYRYFGIYGLPWQRGRISRLFVKYGMLLLKQYVADHGLPDIVHAHSALNGGLLAMEIKRTHGIPFVLTEHSSAYALEKIGTREKLIATTIVKTADYLIAVGIQLAKEMELYFKLNGLIWNYIPNIVNNMFLSYEFNETKSATDKFTLIAVASLVPNKGIDLLLRAFALAFCGQSSINLDIVGDGEQMTKLKTLAVNLGLKTQVSFLGKLSRHDVLVAMSKSNALVLGSYYETFGVVLVEALALGKPVIATKCGGPESIVREGIDGYLVPVGDVRAFADALKRLYKNKSDFSSAIIRQGCAERFGPHEVIKQVFDVYSFLVLGNAS